MNPLNNIFHDTVKASINASMCGVKTAQELVDDLKKVEQAEKTAQKSKGEDVSEKELLILFSDGTDEDIKGIDELRHIVSLAPDHPIREQETNFIHNALEDGKMELYVENLLEFY